MNNPEFIKRLRIGVALLAGFGVGKWLAASFPQHASELFVVGFGVGVVLTQFVLHRFGPRPDGRG